ncbi:MAG: ribose 5-phosphate isomerase B [Anaerolineae bacterium]|nr:ribose 5-phosphate isomerase B [Anaerolineae bacterium]
MRIAIGCDEAGLDLKSVLHEYLQIQEIVPVEIVDHGTDSEELVQYPDIALRVAEAVARGEAERGILICGTGIGMAIVANKVPGIRAAQCHDVYSAERARKSNDAQIITMGARVIGPELAKTIVAAWLPSSFAGGRSAPKVAKIMAIDERFRKLG